MIELIKGNILNALSIILGVISFSQTLTNDMDWKIIILLSSGWGAALLNTFLIFYILYKNDRNVRELTKKNEEIKNELTKKNEEIRTLQYENNLKFQKMLNKKNTEIKTLKEKLSNSENIKDFLITSNISNKTISRKSIKGKD